MSVPIVIRELRREAPARGVEAPHEDAVRDERVEDGLRGRGVFAQREVRATGRDGEARGR